MGKTKIIPLIVRNARTGEYIAPYNIKDSGKPTTENLSKWRDVYNNSFKPGGVNQHLGVRYWIQCKLEIYSQIKRQVVCEYQSPMFEVIND